MKLLTIALAVPVLACAQEDFQSPTAQGAGAADRSQAAAVASPVAPRESTHRGFEAPKYLLPPKKIEAGAFFGGNGFSVTGQANPSLGGEVVLGLDHGFGLCGEGAWNRILGFRASTVEAKAALYDLGGGLQWTPFYWGRFSPYVRGGLSWVHLVAGAQIGSVRFETSTDRLGGNIGFGGRIHLAERYGVLLDFRAVQGRQAAWLGRFSTGMFYHFK